MRRLTTLVAITVVALSLSACGRKGRPIPPEGSTFPRDYPNIEFPQGPSGAQDLEDLTGTEKQTR